MDAFTHHGGRLGEARRRFPAAPTPWIDLSTGINPRPYPAPPATSEARARLPDPEALAQLEATAGRAFGVASDCVLATAGAESAIRLLANVLPAKTVAIVAPTYGGHASAWRDAGAGVIAIDREALAAADDCDVTVVVNPNNPDGAITPLEACARRQDDRGWVIVDEAFIEASAAESLATVMTSAWGAKRLLVLRSFGKFYGLPGVRLGFVLGEPSVITGLRRRLGDWPVSADAIAAGLQAYADGPWAARTQTWLAEAARRMDGLLERAGFGVAGGTSLFRLAVAQDAGARFQRLAQAGLLTRPFADHPTWLRFGLPAPDHWPRVEAAILRSAS